MNPLKSRYILSRGNVRQHRREAHCSRLASNMKSKTRSRWPHILKRRSAVLTGPRLNPGRPHAGHSVPASLQPLRRANLPPSMCSSLSVPILAWSYPRFGTPACLCPRVPKLLRASRASCRRHSKDQVHHLMCIEALRESIPRRIADECVIVRARQPLARHRVGSRPSTSVRRFGETHDLFIRHGRLLSKPGVRRPLILSGGKHAIRRSASLFPEGRLDSRKIYRATPPRSIHSGMTSKGRINIENVPDAGFTAATARAPPGTRRLSETGSILGVLKRMGTPLVPFGFHPRLPLDPEGNRCARLKLNAEAPQRHRKHVVAAHSLTRSINW